MSPLDGALEDIGMFLLAEEIMPGSEKENFSFRRKNDKFVFLTNGEKK